MNRRPSQPKEWQTLDEASSYVRTSKYVISCLIKANVLKCRTEKGRKYVSKESLDKFACLGGPNASWVKRVVWRFRPPKRQRNLKSDVAAHIKRLQDLGLVVRPSSDQAEGSDA